MQNKLMLIIIIVLLVILVASAAGVAFFLISSKKNTAGEKATPTQDPAVVTHLTEEQITDISLPDPIRTNLATSSDGTEHIISLSLSIGVNKTDKKKSPVMTKLIEEKLQVVRAVSLGAIKRKTYQELKRPDGQDMLQQEILSKLQEQFDSNLIVRVEISDMITQ